MTTKPYFKVRNNILQKIKIVRVKGIGKLKVWLRILPKSFILSFRNTSGNQPILKKNIVKLGKDEKKCQNSTKKNIHLQSFKCWKYITLLYSWVYANFVKLAEIKFYEHKINSSRSRKVVIILTTRKTSRKSK